MTSGRQPSRPSHPLDGFLEGLAALSTLSRSPTCGPSTRCRREPAAGVLEMRAAVPAPAARPAGPERWPRTYPRERAEHRRRPAITRTTESSAPATITRSWTRKRSATRSRKPLQASSSSSQMGSSDRLPEVITSGRPTLPEEQMVQGRVGEHQPDQRDCPALPPGRGAVRARGTRTMGARAHQSSATLLRRRSPQPLASSRSRTITANGFASRRFRRRTSRTTSEGGIAGQVDIRLGPSPPTIAPPDEALGPEEGLA